MPPLVNRRGYRDVNTAERKAGKRGGTATAVLLAATVGALALPSAVLAFTSRFDPLPDSRIDADGASFVPAQVDPRLSRSIAVRTLSKGRLFRFTPAASPTRPDRSLTVAVRVDPSAARSLLAAQSLALRDASGGLTAMHIAPTGYSLGAARGYKSFASGGLALADSRAGSRADEIPDLASFQPSAGARSDPSRFEPRVALDEREKTGRSPRTFEGQAEQRVDLGGAYRLTRNLNVTAGVRYQSDRDRLVPVTDGRTDSQAVYVGTQFKF